MTPLSLCQRWSTWRSLASRTATQAGKQVAGPRCACGTGGTATELFSRAAVRPFQGGQPNTRSCLCAMPSSSIPMSGNAFVMATTSTARSSCGFADACQVMRWPPAAALDRCSPVNTRPTWIKRQPRLSDRAEHGLPSNVVGESAGERSPLGHDWCVSASSALSKPTRDRTIPQIARSVKASAGYVASKIASRALGEPTPDAGECHAGRTPRQQPLYRANAGSTSCLCPGRCGRSWCPGLEVISTAGMDAGLDAGGRQPVGAAQREDMATELRTRCQHQER